MLGKLLKFVLVRVRSRKSGPQWRRVSDLRAAETEGLTVESLIAQLAHGGRHAEIEKSAVATILLRAKSTLDQRLRLRMRMLMWHFYYYFAKNRLSW
jgi:hypothetical protein